MTNEIDERYRIQASAQFQRLREDRAAVVGYQYDLGRWLMASLLLINGGALIAIINTDASIAAGAAVWFVGGIVAAMLCGLTTWANAIVAVMIYDEVANTASLVDAAHWPKDVTGFKAFAMPLTFWVSLIAGLGSLALFVTGAIHVANIAAEGKPAGEGSAAPRSKIERGHSRGHSFKNLKH